MTQTGPDDTSPRTSGFHFQLYSPGLGPAVNWRLLSGNNRDMGRGVLGYPDATLCVSGLADVLRRLDELDPLFVPDGNNSWRWFLRHNGVSVVASGHAYDRKVRCKEGHVQFLRYAPDAQLRTDVVVSSSRRWSTVSIDLRERMTTPVIKIPTQVERSDDGVPSAGSGPR